MVTYFKNGKNVVRHDSETGQYAEITMVAMMQDNGSLMLVKNLNTHESGWQMPEEYQAAVESDWDYANMKLIAYASSLG